MQHTLKQKLSVALCALLFASSTWAQESGNQWYSNDIFRDPERPYLYYPDDKVKSKKPADELPQSGEEAQKVLEDLQQSVKLARALAIMNPTTENVKSYIQQQEVVMGKSAMFSDVWRRTIWQNPDLDYSLKHRPTDNVAIKNYDNQQMDKTKQIMANIAETQGLVFFVRGDCQYCHAFAPILKQFQETYGLKVMVVTLDGGTIGPFERETVPDNGIAQRLNVTVTPSLFLADTRNNKFLPIGSGVMSITELETRFVALLNEPGSSF